MFSVAETSWAPWPRIRITISTSSARLRASRSTLCTRTCVMSPSSSRVSRACRPARFAVLAARARASARSRSSPWCRRGGGAVRAARRAPPSRARSRARPATRLPGSTWRSTLVRVAQPTASPREGSSARGVDRHAGRGERRRQARDDPARVARRRALPELALLEQHDLVPVARQSPRARAPTSPPPTTATREGAVTAEPPSRRAASPGRWLPKCISSFVADGYNLTR